MNDHQVIRSPLGLALLISLAAAAPSLVPAQSNPNSDAQSKALSSGVPGHHNPSIIFILADDLGYGDLGCYGQNKIQTPNLDRLAAEGMRFTSFYAGSTVCAPSRCALMTGLHTGHACIRGNADLPLRPEDRTVAEVLRQAGYHNGLVGKWGLGNEHTTGTPQNKGFDEFVGYLDQTHAHDYYTDHLWRYDRATGRDQEQTFYENMDGKKGLYVPDLFTTAATNFVRIHRPDPFNHFQPFFLYLAYTIPHANNEEGKHTGNGMQVPSDAPYSAQPWPLTEKNKAAMITRLDRDVGRLLDSLRRLNLEDRTIVFFSSDNGPHKEGGVDPGFFSSAGPLRGIKRDLYEGGIRVPLIVRWPGRIKAGQVNDDPWAFWDFLPTAADLAGAPVPGNLDGLSMLPTLLGQTQTNRHEFLYWEFHERGFQQAVRMGDWKALRLEPGLPLELYNLKTDLGEKHNVAAQNPEVVAKIEEYLKTARTPAERPAALPASLPAASPAALGAFTVDIVTGDKWKMKPPQLPESANNLGTHNSYIPGSSGPTELTTGFLGGNYWIKVKPAIREPLRLALFGLSGPHAWSIEDPAIADISASDLEAFLDFKKDGATKILVRSGDNVVLRLGVTANTFTVENVWQVTISRQNEEGKTVFIENGKAVVGQ